MSTKILPYMRIIPALLGIFNLSPLNDYTLGGDGIGSGRRHGTRGGNGMGFGPGNWEPFGDGWEYGTGKGKGVGSGYGGADGDCD